MTFTYKAQSSHLTAHKHLSSFLFYCADANIDVSLLSSLAQTCKYVQLLRHKPERKDGFHWVPGGGNFKGLRRKLPPPEAVRLYSARQAGKS